MVSTLSYEISEFLSARGAISINLKSTIVFSEAAFLCASNYKDNFDKRPCMDNRHAGPVKLSRQLFTIDTELIETA